MGIEHVKQLLTRRECIRLEFKEAGKELPGNLFESICAMLNREGGDILLGVNDDGTNDALNDALNIMVSSPVKERLGKELRRIGEKGGLNLQGLMSEFSIERRTTQRDMKLLKDAGFVEFAGPDKTGKYVLTGKGQKIFNT